MMMIYLDRLPEAITEIFFAFSAYHCGDLSLFSNPQIRIFDAEWPECRLSDYKVGDAGRAEAVVVCCLHRQDGCFWKVSSFGKTCSGTARDYRPMIALLAAVQLEKYPKPYVPPEPEPAPYRPPHLFPPEPSAKHLLHSDACGPDALDHSQFACPADRFESEDPDNPRQRQTSCRTQASVDGVRGKKSEAKRSGLENDADFAGIIPPESSHSYLSVELESQRPDLPEAAKSEKKSGACNLM